MSERYKKLTSHGAISIPVAMRRDIGLQGGDPMQVLSGWSIKKSGHPVNSTR